MASLPILKAWSFSRYGDYKLCPLKAKLKHIDRIKEPGSVAMDRGARIHKVAELYIKGASYARVPLELKMFAEELRWMRRQYKKLQSGIVVEETWAFRVDWTETRWDDWAGCWLRVKLDVAHHEDAETIIVTDWKTGRFRPEYNLVDYEEQMELYALGALLLYDHAMVVKPRLVYLDEGIIYPDRTATPDALVFTRDDMPKLKKAWEKRTKAMLSDTRFAPRPNDKCRWCHYRNANKENGGGQCKF